MNDKEVVAQSKAAYGQWKDKWRRHAKEHASFPMKPFSDFQNTGVGRAVLAVANGYSLEEKMPILEAHKDSKVDIMCVDKSLVHLVQHGIRPKFCVVADASVPTEKYLEPIKGQLSDTILFMNVCGNPEWTRMGNWKDVYFYVNKDACQYEKEFMALSGCQNLIAAATNVSNALIVMLTQTDELGPNNFFGYDKVLMLGFDYCWDDCGYYAYDKDGGGKTHYMRHIYIYDIGGRMVYTSSNLHYSARWLNAYIMASKTAVFQTSDRSIFRGRGVVSLEEQLKYVYRPQDSQEIINLIQYRRTLEDEMRKADQRMFAIGRDHYNQVIRTT